MSNTRTQSGFSFITGVLFILAGLRNFFMPGFLSISPRHDTSGTFRAEADYFFSSDCSTGSVGGSVPLTNIPKQSTSQSNTVGPIASRTRQLLADLLVSSRVTDSELALKLKNSSWIAEVADGRSKHFPTRTKPPSGVPFFRTYCFLDRLIPL